ncbi:Acyl-coenzyme A thioesterase 9, mitochondrial [Chamberlinius hualienensis]
MRFLKGLLNSTLKWHSSVQKYTTLSDATEELYIRVGGQKFWKPNEYDRSNLLDMLPNSQNELPPRKMMDSYEEVIIPLAENELLREKYLNHLNTVRFGRILEDMDIFAVCVCYKHVFNPKQKPGHPSPFSIVTALVDEIDLTPRTIRPNESMKLTGHVSWVGKTSIESTMKLYQMRNDEWKELIKARFVMVARNPLNDGSAFINPLQLDSDEDKKIFAEGEVNSLRRKKLADESLLKHPPNEEERELVHSLFLKTLDPTAHSFSIRIKPENTEWMENAKLKNVVVCHPEERNRFNKIFGGFLMRQAFDLSWATAFVYSKTSSCILHVDDIWFRKPVEIGSLLFFSSQVVYTEGPYMQIRVDASVVNPQTNVYDTTNVFYFTFTSGDGELVKTVIPKTYSESMLYLDGKRHFDAAR